MFNVPYSATESTVSAKEGLYTQQQMWENPRFVLRFSICIVWRWLESKSARECQGKRQNNFAYFTCFVV